MPFSIEHPSKRLAGKVFHISSTDALRKENVDKEVSETLKRYKIFLKQHYTMQK